MHKAYYEERMWDKVKCSTESKIICISLSLRVDQRGNKFNISYQIGLLESVLEKP
jgi:hypothetical protein